MLNMEELKDMLQAEYQKGIEHGIKLMEQRLLLAYENGNPIEIAGRAWWLKSDMDNLRDIFSDLESEK